MVEHINRLIQNALVNNSKHITMVRTTMPRVDEIFILNVFHEDLGSDEEPASITSGKDFALVRTVSGKVLCTGKYQSLGIKQSGSLAGKWMELPITKGPKIADCSVGHDGMHAILVSENGAAFFVGLARRGEDGDTGDLHISSMFP